MPAQDGLRFLFSIQDKITADLIKIEKKAKSSAAKIDKAFTRASKSQESNSARAVAAEERRVAAAQRANERRLKQIKREADAFKRSMTRIASAATVAFGAVAANSLSMGGDYDAAMRSVQAKTGATGEVLDKLSDQAREMGRTTVHSATEAARGQAFLAQAGFDANEVLSALPGTLNLATAGELDLSRAADIASNVLTGFALNVSEADRVADVLALTAQSTNTNVEQMGDAMKYAAAVAAAADADFEETAAAIGLLANAGFQGEMGGTALRGAMSKLLNPTKDAQKILDKLGITATTSTGSLLPLNEIVAQFEHSGLTAGDAMKVFGQRAGPGMLALVGQGSDALIELTGELKNAEGTAQKTADIMGGGLWGAMKKFQSIAESAFISFGERLAPAVVWGANVFGDLPGPIQEVVVIVGSLVAAMGGLMLIMPQSFGSLVQLPGKLAKLVTSINLVRVRTIAMTVAQKAATAAQWLFNAAMNANPIGLIIAAVGLLVIAWHHWGDEIKAFLRVVWDKMMDKVGWGLQALSGFVGIFEEDWAKAMNSAGASLRETTSGIDKAEEATAKATQTTDKATTARKKSIVVTKVATEEEIKFAEAVQGITDTWTGATLKSEEFLKAFENLTPAQKENERIMGQVLQKYDSMRKILGPFNAELEAIWQTTEGLNPEIAAQRKETEKLEKAAKKLAEKALKELNKEKEKLKKKAEEVAERLDNLRRRLLGLPTDEAILSFDELTQTWEGLNEAEREVATKEYAKSLTAAAKAGNTLDEAQIAIIKSTEEAKESASGYELALASLAGQMGGASGQALNLVIAMREHNKEQRAAAKAGKETEEEFSQIQQRAATLGFAFTAIGDAIGGTAGKVMSELGTIAQAFATGGIVGGIMAGISSLVKGLKGLFGRGKRKREAAAKEAREAATAAAEAAAKIAAAMNSIRLELLGLPTLAVAEDFDLLRKVWEKMSESERAQGMDQYVSALQSAADAGIVLEASEQSLLDAFLARDAAMKEATARQDAELSALANRQSAELSGLESQIDALDSRLNPKISEVQALLDQQQEEMELWKNLQAEELAGMNERRQAALDEMTSRQESEMASLSDRQAAELSAMEASQNSALESLTSQQESEMSSLASRQESELAALDARRKATLDVLESSQKERLSILKETQAAELESLKAMQSEQLAILKETQSQRLSDLKAAQAAELSEIEAARAANLGVVEAAIARELEDERIAVQLGIDLRKAGSDQAAAEAAIARAEEATQRLRDRDEFNLMMEEAEGRVRSRYQDELDTINTHWDEVEAEKSARFQNELAVLEESHSEQLGALETAQSEQLSTLETSHGNQLTELQSFQDAVLQANIAYFDALEEETAARHAVELESMTSAHSQQMEALQTNLALRRQALETSQALELTALEASQAAELQAHNGYWDALHLEMMERHAVELAAVEAWHVSQQEALLASLTDRRDAMLSAHATELLDLQDSHAAKLAEIESFWSAAKQAEIDGAAAIPTVPAPTPYTPPEVLDPLQRPKFMDPGFDGFQHGGPVRAGRPILVGEAGPELFIPSQGGRIDPNVSGAGGGVDAKAIAEAVAKGLQGAKFEADGRQFGRLTIRHQPIAVAELGGRR